MFNITLIATVHKECGFCSSNELLKIIERVDPEVIFEELSITGFMAIYEGSRKDSLETSTIKRYLENHQIAHVPVDLDGNGLIDKRQKNDIEEMVEILNNNIDYIKLSNQRGYFTEQHGFPFLNSVFCIEIMEDLRKLEEDILRSKNHDKLLLTYKKWLDINDLRENEMIKNIYNYCDLNKFNRALFLIGAEHRKPILGKVAKLEKIQNLELNWIFDYFN